MKTHKKVSVISIFASVLILGCTSEKKSQAVVDFEKAKLDRIENLTDKTEKKILEKEILAGSSKLVYISNYLFTYDKSMSSQLMTYNPAIIDAGYFALNVSKSVGEVGLAYSKYSVKPSLNLAADGMVKGFEGSPGVTVTGKKDEDVSKTIGFPSVLKTGRIKLDEPGKEILNGEYMLLVIQKDKEIYMFQGIFDIAGTENGKDFTKLLRSIKVLEIQ